MIALDILKQIETELNIKLEKSDGIAYFSKAYTLDKEGQVTGLGLYNCGFFAKPQNDNFNPEKPRKSFSKKL